MAIICTHVHGNGFICHSGSFINTKKTHTVCVIIMISLREVAVSKKNQSKYHPFRETHKILNFGKENAFLLSGSYVICSKSD